MGGPDHRKIMEKQLYGVFFLVDCIVVEGFMVQENKSEFTLTK